METQNIDLDIFKGEAFCRAACWFDLNTLATDSDKRIMWLGKAIDLKAHQLATSVRLLADRWNMTAQTTRTRLKEFVEAGLIAMERIGTALIITISPDKEQQVEPQNETDAAQPIEVQSAEIQPNIVTGSKFSEPQIQTQSEQQTEATSPKSDLILNAKHKLRHHRLKSPTKLPRKLKKRLKSAKLQPAP